MKNKKLIILAIVMPITCLAIAFGITYLFSNRHRASSFGVTEKGKSALVIQNKSDFFILDVTIQKQNEKEQKWEELISKGGQKVFTIEPGSYDLYVHYSDHAYIPNMGFYVSNTESATFSVGKGSAAKFVLEGGMALGAVYRPPNLVEK
jgi:hypothetical protein